MTARAFVSERIMHLGDYHAIGIIEIVKTENLLGLVTNIKPFIKQLVLEFHINLSKDIFDQASLNYRCTIVRED